VVAYGPPCICPPFPRWELWEDPRFSPPRSTWRGSILGSSRPTPVPIICTGPGPLLGRLSLQCVPGAVCKHRHWGDKGGGAWSWATHGLR
ncbi:unnamed protein product, partial [Lampetra planeri]